ncbi:MAG: ATP-dependent Clp protease adaptor ClpS [Flavobacteriales bacterium]|nr:ATP-dependent Clp protease adaptor ClpS [Flavobacteriales bacterium]MBK7555520.1 ATP-dependent Clp protease adaptor ClpS [Flavobacteriales bacterium]MBP6573111.1 ATP-dependent Clp protease adaptor ClpS [Flavobacteriales bacterium]
MSAQVKEQEVGLLEREASSSHEIVLHNDDVNTFSHVIISLMEVCSHEPLQAEQCAWIVHNNGKCSVKRGAYDDLEPMCSALQIRGLSADIN